MTLYVIVGLLIGFILGLGAAGVSRNSMEDEAVKKGRISLGGHTFTMDDK